MFLDVIVDSFGVTFLGDGGSVSDKTDQSFKVIQRVIFYLDFTSATILNNGHLGINVSGEFGCESLAVRLRNVPRLFF